MVTERVREGGKLYHRSCSPGFKRQGNRAKINRLRKQAGVRTTKRDSNTVGNHPEYAAEKAKRIEVYAKRVEAGLPLFEETPCTH